MLQWPVFAVPVHANESMFALSGSGGNTWLVTCTCKQAGGYSVPHALSEAPQDNGVTGSPMELLSNGHTRVLTQCLISCPEAWPLISLTVQLNNYICAYVRFYLITAPKLQSEFVTINGHTTFMRCCLCLCVPPALVIATNPRKLTWKLSVLRRHLDHVTPGVRQGSNV